MCYRCFWPKPQCWCDTIIPMPTRTHFVFLMHPKEWKQEKAATGRLTHLCLPNSVVHVGTEFDSHAAVQALIADSGNSCVLVYPGRDAVNLSTGAWPRGALEHRRLVVFLLDATWSLGRKMLRLSPSLQRLPRVVFTPSAPSRYLIKQQPHPSCLSTLEAVHELLVALERGGHDAYPQPDQLLNLFGRMQAFQIACASDPARDGYRRSGYRPPAERKPFRGQSGSRRARVFQAPAA
ncbi:MAG: tRNA-uridine aminocarboxypropyltransferase [Opitutaceae bacterium]|nr:tRNA-uridine aminocarboxypropyltransferase [Opitutaceae bacterium]